MNIIKILHNAVLAINNRLFSRVNKNLLYIGVLVIVCSYFMFWVTEPYVFSKPTDELIPVKISGTLALSTIKARGGPETLFGVRTLDGLVQLNCSAPSYVECFPNAKTYNGMSVTALVIPIDSRFSTLRRISTVGGAVLADESYFDQRTKMLKQSAMSFLTITNIIGGLIALASLFIKPKI